MQKLSRTSLIAIGSLLVTWLIFFSRTLTGRAAYFLDDLKIIYYPLEYAYAQFQAAGQLPLWSPYFGFGHPLLAWGQLGFFTPLHVILRAWHIAPLLLLQISIMAYFGLGLTGFYLFLRRYLPALPATLGAIVFAFSGFNIGHLNHVNFYVGTMLVPWLLLAVDSFIAQPSLKKTAAVAALGSAIAVSAQPQVVTYSFILVLIVAITLFSKQIISSRQQTFTKIYVTKTLGLSALAAIIALCLSAIAILPLAEFLPQTERNASLPEQELYEFSYTPANTITLVFPYFFGDHDSYWGPKGLQELAAFTGILPLLLSIYALATWKKQPALRGAAAALCIIGIAFALGQYSPLYHFLVTQKILTSLAIPGRFVFFFDTGIAILAATGLQDIMSSQNSRKKHLITSSLALIVVGLLILAPVFISANSTPRIAIRLHSVLSTPSLTAFLVVIGILLWIIMLLTNSQIHRRWLSSLFLIISSTTLTIYGFNFNPTTPWTLAFASNPFQQDLTTYRNQSNAPPRLYSRQALLTTSSSQKQLPTDYLGPQFSIYQPVSLSTNNRCLVIPFSAEPNQTDTILVSLHQDVSTPPLAKHPLTTLDLISQPKQTICFSQKVLSEAPNNQIIAITSEHPSKINSYYIPTPNSESVYFIRVNNPSSKQLKQSIKLGKLIILPAPNQTLDDDNLLLSRHLQTTAFTSSARWIGALSIRPYREFIEVFFANDNDEPFNGDGKHAIEEWRSLLNMAGVTHLAQAISPNDSDRMQSVGFETVAEYQANNEIFRLYQNPDAYPKTWLVPSATYVSAADDTRYAMMSPDFDPHRTVYISGPTPPEQLTNSLPFDESSTTTITQYDNTEVKITVDSASGGWLVFSDATTDQWDTYIDNELSPHYVANTVFKAAQVPPGQHTVSFIYHSPATNLAQKLGLAGLFGLFLLLLPYQGLRRTIFHEP